MMLQPKYKKENTTVPSVTYSFHQLSPEELNVGKEDWGWYPENLHSFWLIYLDKAMTMKPQIL